ncbi:MAG: YqgE/AlgH family protein [Ferruginibacter sp.]|jgi:putative transcriptional regulator|nr:YqgE/AlgH family protein [Ferruginibacter sp.]
MIEPAQNTLLIADPFLKDPNFMRTVVFMCRHSDEGSFGFVLNKAVEQTLDLLITGLDGTEVPVYYGGPVQTDTVHYIHQYPDLIPDCYKISDEIYWGGDFETVKTLLNSNKIENDKIKFFVGYSGWEKGQLAEELAEKSWLTATTTRNLVFNTAPEDVWKESLKHLGGEYEMLINYPIDPQLN